MSAKVSAKIRMFRLDELGDCFLVTFTSGASVSHLLVDCGSFRNGSPSIKRLQRVTAAIGAALDGQPIDVVVGTHQHNDHVSGFVHCESAFKAIGVRQVWLSWLDDPLDPQATTIGADHHNLRLTLAAARDELKAIVGRRPVARPEAARSLDVVDGMLGFLGLGAAGGPPDVPVRGIKILKEISGKNPDYLTPGRTLDLPGLPPGSVRVHVLGPPRKDSLRYRANPKKGESYDLALATHRLQATKFLDALKNRKSRESSEESDYPFNQPYKVPGSSRGSRTLDAARRRYRQRRESWRTIDDAWMEQAATLALYLDEFTNNSSLALAIELVDSQKVLLFAADAQIGNWVSWNEVVWEQEGVTTDQLLARTVFYKVGHHASHNATLVDAFEKMNHPDLVAFIPVHKKDPNITKKTNPWKMPAANLFRRIQEKTSNRVLQMDNLNPPECDPSTNPAKAAWTKVGIKPVISNDAIEIDIA
jgi:glyoxylase-like metal-dependent hydrolase (beta-lactamase superfamily II)